MNTDHDVTGDLSGTYLKKQDVEDGPLSLTIASVDKETFESRNGRPPESKWVLTFAGEPTRKMTLNKTNLQLLAKAFGKRTAPWLGQTVEVVLDESVSFNGQLVGGLRIRVPRPHTRTAAVTVMDPHDPLPAV